MNAIVHYAAGAVAIPLWLPVLWRFRRHWRERDNPVSLAIATHIIVWVTLLTGTPVWMSQGVSTETLTWAGEALGVLVAGAYYGAFWIEKRRFKSDRR